MKPSKEAQQRNRKSKAKQGSQPIDQRPLASIPRRLLTIATVIGGVIGLILSQLFGWTIMQTFLYTLMFAGFAILITAVGYRTIKR